jgi:hypothetical protein
LYRPVWLDRFTLDVLAGARAWILDTELEFKPGLLAGRIVSKSSSGPGIERSGSTSRSATSSSMPCCTARVFGLGIRF